MSVRLAEVTGVGLVLAVTAAGEAVGLRAGRAGLVVLAALILVAFVVVLVRVDLRAAGIGATLACAFTLSWNGVFLGPARPGDVLIFVAVGALALHNPSSAFSTPPWWIKQLIAVLAVGVAVQTYFPPSETYLSSRFVISAVGVPQAYIQQNVALLNAYVAFKFIVAVALLPIAFVGAVRIEPRALRWLVIAFVSGTAVSAWVAGVDHFGTNIGSLLTGLNNVSTRQIGFSNHPNYLSASVVVAMPFAYWLIFRGPRLDRLIGVWSIAGLLLGVYASGSRGGAVGVLIGLTLAVVINPRTRVYAPNLLAGAAALAGLIAVLLPGVGGTILRVTRLANGAVSIGSDQVRTLAAAQGWADFHHSPLFGIGLQVSDQASQVYLGELASGGLLLFFGVSLYMVGGLLASGRTMQRVPLAGAVFVALTSMLALNFVEPDLTDRFYYVPGAVIVALLDTTRRNRQAAAPTATAAQPLAASRDDLAPA